ncbi:MAG TPA: ribosome small subunit-dependent GTPase A [Armatimonadota bacterium]
MRQAELEGDGQDLECHLPADMTAAQQTSVAVGDRIAFGPGPNGEPTLMAVEPRTSTLSRPDPMYRHIERVVAANMDVVVIVVSAKAPPLHPKLIDRYLIAVQRGGAEPLLCLNKVDQLEDERDRAKTYGKLEPYRQIGLRVVLCSAEQGDGVDDLRAALGGKRCVFVGHSGVGKSSLLNALHPELRILTREVSEGYGRGRHTTTASQLYALPNGTEVIDTPGVREFGLWKLRREDVCWYFPEFVDAAEDCRYTDCSHTHEPQCGVKQALASGRISHTRYDSYQRILGSL